MGESGAFGKDSKCGSDQTQTFHKVQYLKPTVGSLSPNCFNNIASIFNNLVSRPPYSAIKGSRFSYNFGFLALVETLGWNMEIKQIFNQHGAPSDIMPPFYCMMLLHNKF